MSDTKNNKNSNVGCKDYEILADDYFKSVFSKKSSLGHSKYIKSNISDSCSIDITQDNYNNCNYNNSNISINSLDVQENTSIEDFDLNGNILRRQKNNNHEGQKYFIDEEFNNCDYQSYHRNHRKTYPHNHEIATSVDFEDSGNKCHNHRTCGLTSDAIMCDNSHIHDVHLYTDTVCNHIHEICDTTSKAIYLPNGKHFHIIKGSTTTSDGHRHNYYFITLIDNPSEN